MAKKKTAKKAAPKGAGKRDATLANTRALEKRLNTRIDKALNRIGDLEEAAGIVPDDNNL